MEGSPQEPDSHREALLRAVEDTDISFFSPIFDNRYADIISKPHPGRTAEDMFIEAIEYALKQPPAAGRDILKAYKEGHPGTQQYSPRCRQALDYYITHKSSERIPAPSEVQAVFEKLAGKAEYTERRKLEDVDGLYLWEVEIHGENGSTEYQYKRAGQHPEVWAANTEINVIFKNEDGAELSGWAVATRSNGTWEMHL